MLILRAIKERGGQAAKQKTTLVSPPSQNEELRGGGARATGRLFLSVFKSRDEHLGKCA